LALGAEGAELRPSRGGRKLKCGYGSQPQLAIKRARLQQLRTRKALLDRDLQARRVHIARGGKRPPRNRLHLDQAGTTKEQWRARWDASWNASAWRVPGERAKTRNHGGRPGTAEVGKERWSRPGVTYEQSAGAVEHSAVLLGGCQLVRTVRNPAREIWGISKSSRRCTLGGWPPLSSLKWGGVPERLPGRSVPTAAPRHRRGTPGTAGEPLCPSSP